MKVPIRPQWLETEPENSKKVKNPPVRSFLRPPSRQKEPKAEPKEENGVPKNEPVPATKPPLNCAKHGVPKHALPTVMCRCMCIMPVCFCDAHVLPGLSLLARGCQGGVVPFPFAAPRLRRLQVYSSFGGMEH